MFQCGANIVHMEQHKPWVFNTESSR